MPDDRLVAVVAEAKPSRPAALLKVPRQAGNPARPWQDFLDVGVADAACPRQRARISRHRGNPHQRLQVVPVGFSIRGGEGAEPRRHRRVGHRVRDHVHHPVEPRRAAQVLGDRDEPVLGILRRAEEARSADFVGGECEIARYGTLDGRVPHLVSQHLHHPSVVQVRIGEMGRQDQVGIEIGSRVVRRVEPFPAIGHGTIGQEQRSRVRVSHPGVQDAARCLDGAFELRRVGPGPRHRHALIRRGGAERQPTQRGCRDHGGETGRPDRRTHRR